jgi:hypothetical protein
LWFKVTEPKTTILISTKLGIDYEKSFGKRYGYEAAKAGLPRSFIKMKIQTIYASANIKILVRKISRKIGMQRKRI